MRFYLFHVPKKLISNLNNVSFFKKVNHLICRLLKFEILNLKSLTLMRKDGCKSQFRARATVKVALT